MRGKWLCYTAIMAIEYNDDQFAHPGEPKRGQCVLYRNAWFRPDDFPVGEIQSELSSFGVNQKTLEIICARMHAKPLFIKGMTATDLSPLEGLQHLERLHIFLAHKFTDASPIATLKNLKTLLIEDTKRWQNLNQLSGSSVVHLELSGGMTKVGTYESLEPLSRLPYLEDLVLTHFGVNDGGLRPLGKCKNLRRMILDCRFPTEEYAFLSVH